MRESDTGSEVVKSVVGDSPLWELGLVLKVARTPGPFGAIGHFSKLNDFFRLLKVDLSDAAADGSICRVACLDCIVPATNQNKTPSLKPSRIGSEMKRRKRKKKKNASPSIHDIGKNGPQKLQ